MVVLPNIRRKYMVSRLPQGATVDIAECLVSLATDSVPYTGSARTVGVTVTWGGATLSLNTDYTLSYANNTNVGPATVTVTGIGQFVGSATKTFYVTSAAVVPFDWSGVDLSRAGAEAASASLVDGDAVLVPYHIQAIDDSRLFFADTSGRKLYIWGFGAGHPFEVAHLAASYMSASEYFSDCQSAAMSSDGKTVVYSKFSYGYIWKRVLGTSFDLSTAGTQSGVLTGTYYNARIFLSKDGEKFVRKVQNGNEIYVYDCAPAFDYSEPTSNNGCNMDNYSAAIRTLAGVSSGSVSWKDFVFSDDGTVLIASVTVGGVEHVVKIDFETAWKMNSGTVHSVFAPPDVSGVQALAVNSDGTRLLLFCTGDNKIHEYPLSA